MDSEKQMSEREKFEAWLDARRSASPLQSPTLFEAYCAALSAPAVPQWMPIETAPKDGRRVLIYMPETSHQTVQEAYWAVPWEGAADAQCWWSTPHGPAGRGYTILPKAVTHWMPLPAAPGTSDQLTPAVPPGFVLVPVEPTQEMLDAAAVRFANGNAVYKNVTADALKIEEGIYGEVYAAMLAAAPSAKGPT